MSVSMGDRKSVRAGEAAGPGIEMKDGTWHIRDAECVREVLQPILFADGEEHRQQR